MGCHVRTRLTGNIIQYSEALSYCHWSTRARGAVGKDDQVENRVLTLPRSILGADQFLHARILGRTLAGV